MYVADGQYSPGEPKIAGVIISLSLASCSQTAILATTTNINGSYSFTGLTAGTYCVSVSLTNPKNEVLLLPGMWTYPNSSATALITLTEGQARTGVDFGWDDQPPIQ